MIVESFFAESVLATYMCNLFSTTRNNFFLHMLITAVKRRSATGCHGNICGVSVSIAIKATPSMLSYRLQVVASSDLPTLLICDSVTVFYVRPNEYCCSTMNSTCHSCLFARLHILHEIPTFGLQASKASWSSRSYVS